MSKKRRKSLPLTIYIEPWLKVMAKKKAEAMGTTLSDYIREVIRGDLGIFREYDPMDVIITKLEDGISLYDVNLGGKRDE